MPKASLLYNLADSGVFRRECDALPSVREFREAMVRDWGAFVNFLRLAAGESEGILNYSAIARETGLAIPTVKSHYQLLEDMFVGNHVPAFTRSLRKNLLSTPRFFLFDLGVRHAASGVRPGPDVVVSDPGWFLEHWIVLELRCNGRRVPPGGMQRTWNGSSGNARSPPQLRHLPVPSARRPHGARGSDPLACPMKAVGTTRGFQPRSMSPCSMHLDSTLDLHDTEAGMVHGSDTAFQPRLIYPGAPLDEP